MLNLQGLPFSYRAVARREGASDRQLGMMVGNAIATNVLRAIFAEDVDQDRQAVSDEGGGCPAPVVKAQAPSTSLRQPSSRESRGHGSSE